MKPIETPDTVSGHPDRDSILSLESLLTYIPKSAGRVLDCTGAFGKRGIMLKQHGAREVVALADTTAGTPVPNEGYDEIIQGPLDFVTLPDVEKPFDCILCTSALERLRNPSAFLTPLLERLVPGGLFIAVVPNLQYHKTACALAKGRWIYGDSGVWDRNNLRFFTAAEIKSLARRSGLGTCRIASLFRDNETAFPRDAMGFARKGNLRVGPLNDPAYQAWLTEYYIVMAVKPVREVSTDQSFIDP